MIIAKSQIVTTADHRQQKRPASKTKESRQFSQIQPINLVSSQISNE